MLHGVRARWRALRVLQAVVRAGLSVSAVLAAAMLATRSIDRSPALPAFVGLALVVFVTVALVWAFAPLGRMPDDGQVARSPVRVGENATRSRFFCLRRCPLQTRIVSLLSNLAELGLFFAAATALGFGLLNLK